MTLSRCGLFLVLGALAACYSTALLSHAQAPAASTASIDAQREAIWDSPAMLHARAWLKDYTSKSAKITPAEAKEYMAELEKLSPAQMKLWLLKFNEQDEQRQQQQAFWMQAHSASLARARQANQNTQQAYADIDKGESQSALAEQSQLNTRQNEELEGGIEKQQEMGSETNGYLGYGYGGFGPVYNGIHYHIYPGAY